MHGPQSLADLLQRGGELPAGVVDEDIDGAEPLPTASRKVSTSSGSRTSHGMARTSRPAGLELGPHGLEQLRPPSTDRDARAGPNQLLGRGASDAGAAARHDRDPAGQGIVGERGPELL